MLSSSSKFMPEKLKQWSSQPSPMMPPRSGGAIEYRGCTALLQPKHWKRKHYANLLHVAILLIYFTLRPIEDSGSLSLTPSRINMHGMGAETEFLDRRLRSVAMWFRSRPMRMWFRRPLLFRSSRFGLPAFCLVHLRLAAFGHLLQLFDLFRGQLGQAPDEGDERPDGFRAVFPAERRHSRKAHAVRDDVEKLAVGQLLCIRLCQVGNLRIEIAAVESVAAAGSPVTHGAVLDDMLAGFGRARLRYRVRVLHFFDARRRSDLSRLSGQNGFNPRRLFAGAESVIAEPDHERDNSGQRGKNDDKNCGLFCVHHHTSMFRAVAVSPTFP